MKTQLLRALNISAASGLVNVQDRFYAIADDEHCLICFTENPNSPIEKVRLFAGELPDEPAERKKLKPDLESLVYVQELNALLAVPSGSTPNRCRGALINLQPDGVGKVSPIDFTDLFLNLQKSINDLNIEGAVLFGDRFKLFQRGNSARGENSIINLNRQIILEDLRAGCISAKGLQSVVKCDLGNLNGVPLGFTDAAVVAEQIHFIAVAERTDSTYDDGEFAGAILGRLNNSDQVEFQEQLICSVKPEGLCARGSELYLVTDADDRNTFSELYFIPSDSGTGG